MFRPKKNKFAFLFNQKKSLHHYFQTQTNENIKTKVEKNKNQRNYLTFFGPTLSQYLNGLVNFSCRFIKSL